MHPEPKPTISIVDGHHVVNMKPPAEVMKLFISTDGGETFEPFDMEPIEITSEGCASK